LENLIDPIIILDNKAVLMNTSLEEISEKLYFGLHASIPANAFYSEPVPGGYLCVMENDDLGESKVNLEALFNATMQHKKRMQELFAPNAAEVSTPSLRPE
jgi:ABC-2 type transport system ATP-binding protein